MKWHSHGSIEKEIIQAMYPGPNKTFKREGAVFSGSNGQHPYSS